METTCAMSRLFGWLFTIFFLSGALHESHAQTNEEPKVDSFIGNVALAVYPDRHCAMTITSNVTLGAFGLLGPLGEALLRKGGLSAATIDGFKLAEKKALESDCARVEVRLASAIDEAPNDQVAMTIGRLIREKGYETSLALTQKGYSCGNACAYLYIAGTVRHQRHKADLLDSRRLSGITLNGCLDAEYVEAMLGAYAKQGLANLCNTRITTQVAKDLKIVNLEN